MKICSSFALLLTSRLVTVFLSMMGVVVWNCAMQQLFNGELGHTDARCIHDKLEFTFKGPSPQTYNQRVMNGIKSTTVEPRTNSQTDKTRFVTTPGYTYYYQYQTRFHQTTQGHKMDLTTELGSAEKHKSERSGEDFVSKTVKSNAYEPANHRNERSVSNTDATNTDDDTGNTIDDGIVYVDDLSDNDTVAELYNNITYQPIRLTIWYDFKNIAFKNDSSEYERLKEGLDKAVEQIRNIFSVIQVEGNLLLTRHEACGAYWPDQSTHKHKKCGRITSGYGGEKCLDDFQIPDDHLNGFETYDRNSSDPREVHFLNGTGISNTDTVIYVRSANTQKCSDGGIIAYAAYCQLDQFNRPVAGFANFCPNHLSSDSFDSEKFYFTVLHEFFHVLGFSQKLFKKFQICHRKQERNTKGIEDGQSSDAVNNMLICENRGDAVDYVDNWYRILTPAVSQESADHFNCTTIGGPLESNFQNKQESSHWEARYIQPSLMTASIGLPHLTVIDRITLAAFKDMGWYKVNMSQADELMWGLDAGCEFGTKQYCHSGNNSFFCTASHLVNGCHYLNLDKGVCKTNDFLDSCQVYKPEKRSECWNPSNAKNNLELWKGETFNINSRCFISNLSSQEHTEGHHITKRSINQEGRCYEHRCNGTRTLEIRVRGSDWAVCPFGRRIKIPGYDGNIICPSPTILCNPKINFRITSRSGSAICVRVNISFGGLRRFISADLPPGVTPQSRFEAFTKKLRSIVNNLIKGNGTSVTGQMLLRGDTITFSLKADRSNTRACREAVRRLKVMVTGKVLAIMIGDKELMANRMHYRYTLRPCGPEKANTTKPPEVDTRSNPNPPPPAKEAPPAVINSGIIAASVVGVVCVGVFASVGALLYWKSIVPRAVGPSSTGPEVQYQPNSGSPASTSENGSVGQMQFAV